MKLSRNQIWVLILSGFFILVNAVFISIENFLFVAVPFGLLIVYLGFFHLDKLFLLVTFMVPLSVPLNEFVENLDIGMNLPSEPIIFGILIVFIFKLIYEGKFDKNIAYHPISIAIYINLIWILITCITSTMPLVSFKYLLSRVWFVVVFYFLATQIFTVKKNISLFQWLYIIGFIIVIGYFFVRLAPHGLFNQRVAHWAVNPFYNDHTSYGAIIAMFLPVLIGFGVMKKYSLNRKLVIWLIVSIFLVAVIFSYTRAAWVSLAGVLGVWMVIKLRIKFTTLAILGSLIFIVILLFRTQIMLELGRNSQDSSTDIQQHLKSISNVRSDASNLERLNRWHAALRMFQEKPIFGWGPGTYMFQYAPYQLSYEKTIISTNAGDMGNAHSEYIGPLAEEGIFGMLTFLAIVILTVYTGITTYFKLKDKDLRIATLATLLGLITYYVHGFLNNFLDTDKASIPFWGFTAIIVTINAYYLRKEEEELKELQSN